MLKNKCHYSGCKYITPSNPSNVRCKKKQPVKGEWFSEFSKILDEFQINLGHESIKMMSRQDFKRLTKDKSEEKAFMS